MQTRPVLSKIHLMLDTIDHEADALGIDPRRAAVWSGSAGVPFGFIASLDHPSVLPGRLLWTDGPADR